MTDLESIARLAQSGQLRAACEQCDQALNTEPDNPEFLHLRGLLFSLSGKPDEAIRQIRRAIALRSQPKYWSNLGNALVTVNRLEDAERAFREAIALDAAFATAWFNLGKLLVLRQRFTDAADAFGHSTRLESADPEGWKSLGNVLEQLGQPQQAHAVYEQGLAASPGDPGLSALAAYCLERENRLDEARVLAEASLAREPANGLASLVLAVLDRRAGRVAEARARLLAMTDTGLSLPMQVKREHELGVLEDRLRAHESAYRHFSRAKSLQARLPEYARFDCMRYLSMLEHLIRQDYSWMAGCNSEIDDGRRDPVLIVGFPRSGTTLLNQFLNGHPQLFVMEETPLLLSLERRLAEMHVEYPAGLSGLTAAQVRSLRQEYFTLARSAHPDWDGERRLVDKLPLNLTRLPLAARLFPGSRLLLSLRHPYDACLSGFMQLFSPNDAMACFADLGTTARMYDRLFTLWERLAGHLPIPVLPVKYENLVQDTEREIRSLMAFLDLPWMESLLDHTRTVGARGFINTPSYHQVARPVHRESLQRWESYAPYFRRLDDLLQPHAKALGYEVAAIR